MNNTALLLEMDDLPIVGDAPIGLLRYAAKKEKSRRFNRQQLERRKLSMAQSS